jgi:hypothetical protein
VYKDLIETGAVPDELGYARGKEYWDSGAGAAANFVNARNLTSGMALSRTGDSWGGTPQSAQLRERMAPESREAVSLSGGQALRDFDVAAQGRAAIKQAFVDHGLQPAAPRPSTQRPEPPSPVPAPAPEASVVDKVKAAVGAATEAAQTFTREFVWD